MASILRGLGWLASRITKLLSRTMRKLENQLKGAVTEEFLNILLKVMKLTFRLFGGYRKNIKGFQGRYHFEAVEEDVLTSVVFNNGKMNFDIIRDDGKKAEEREKKNWDAKVSFVNAVALNKFIISGFDVFDPLLNNEVTLEGNMTYAFKFFFLIKDLMHRFGLE